MSFLAILRAVYLMNDSYIGILFGRILFTAVALSVLTGLIMPARKNSRPINRSWLWALCVPLLIFPFERSAVAVFRQVPAESISGIGLAFGYVTSFFFLPFWKYIWLAGFIFCAARNGLRYRKTVHMMKAGKLKGCAAYFYRFRSRVYTPPDFLTAYTEAERAMLLSHETQHIRQHDPLLYRVLQFVQCVFWFNPLTYKAAKMIRQDRELLCDERVTRGCSKYDYGMLLLSEAKKGIANPALAGISSHTGVYERVAACAKPFPNNKKAAVAVALFAALAFAAGFAGFSTPIVTAQMEVIVNVINAGSLKDATADNITWLCGAEKFAVHGAEGMTLNQEGLYGFALAEGLKPEQMLSVNVIEKARDTMFGRISLVTGDAVTVAELKTRDIFIPYLTKGGDGSFWDGWDRIMGRIFLDYL